MLFGLPYLLLWWFPVQGFPSNSYSELMQNVMWDALNAPVVAVLAPPVVVSCSVLNHMGYIGSSCGGFLFFTYSKLMQNVRWATMDPPAAFLSNS